MPKKSKDQKDKGNQGKGKKESIADFTTLVDKKVLVKFIGGRQVQGILKGYDPTWNLILDDTEEEITNPTALNQSSKRQLGLVFIKGTTVMFLCPEEGFEPIQNPFGVDE